MGIRTPGKGAARDLGPPINPQSDCLERGSGLVNKPGSRRWASIELIGGPGLHKPCSGARLCPREPTAWRMALPFAISVHHGDIGLAATMRDRRTIHELKELGAQVPAPEHIASLYRQAYDEFGTLALWNRKRSDHPSIAQALIVAQALSREGTMAARPLAVTIEQACRAAL